jgi:DNA-binding GntR family transcriptional regulator
MKDSPRGLPSGDGAGLLKPFRHESPGASTERAAAYLRRLIFTRVLVPGSHVPAAQIAQTLGMTRIPVREALLVLQHEGRVRIEPNRGAFVTMDSTQSAQDSNELFSVMEDFACTRAAKRATPEDLQRLRQAQDDVHDATDPVQLFHAFEQFQESLVTAGLDARLAGFYRRLRQRSPDSIYEQLPSLVAAVKLTTERVVSALEAGDGALAAQNLRELRESALEQYAPLLRGEPISAD